MLFIKKRAKKYQITERGTHAWFRVSYTTVGLGPIGVIEPVSHFLK